MERVRHLAPFVRIAKFDDVIRHGDALSGAPSSVSQAVRRAVYACELLPRVDRRIGRSAPDADRLRVAQELFQRDLATYSDCMLALAARLEGSKKPAAPAAVKPKAPPTKEMLALARAFQFLIDIGEDRSADARMWDSYAAVAIGMTTLRRRVVRSVGSRATADAKRKAYVLLEGRNDGQGPVWRDIWALAAVTAPSKEIRRHAIDDGLKVVLLKMRPSQSR